MRRQQLWMLLVIFALAVVVRVGVVSRSGLWADEFFSLAVATGHSLEGPAALANSKLGDFVEPDRAVDPEVFRRYLRHDNPPASPARVLRAVLISDTSPPLYYLLLYGWTLLLGANGTVLRLFSIVCSLACLPLLADIARRVGGRRAVLPACLLFTLSPLGIYYSTEGRMYSLLWLCVLATTWASLNLYEREGDTKANLALWVLASAAGFLTHYFFLFPWSAMVALLVTRPGHLRRRSLGLCVFVTGLIILPWYLKFLGNLHTWRVTDGWLHLRPLGFDYLAWPRVVTQFFAGHEKHLWPSSRRPSLFALVLFAILAAAMIWRFRRCLLNPRLALLWLPFAASCVGPAMLDLAGGTYMLAVSRYVVAALPAAYLLASLALLCLRNPARTGALILILLAWSGHVWSLYRSPYRSDSPIRQITRAASANCGISDLILVHSIPSGVLGVAYYTTAPAAMASWVGQLRTRHVPESIQQLAAGRTRILFLKVHYVLEPAPEEDWLRANAVVVREMHLITTTLIEFRPRNAETF